MTLSNRKARRAAHPPGRLPAPRRAGLAASTALCLGLGLLAPAAARAGTQTSTPNAGVQPMVVQPQPPVAAPANVNLTPGGENKPISGNEPVAFQADSVTYDRDHAIISATGHVRAWQNGHFLSADRVTFDRNTGVAAGYGHVVIVEPDGQVTFAEYAELSNGMKQGIMRGMSSLLLNGGKMVANGARRTDGKLNELSRAVYTACDLCLLDPSSPVEWQIRSDHMVQDLENKRIEWYDAWLDIHGVPIFYMPYMSSTDPSVKRQSGFLPPTLGATDEHLGTFLAVPYYWAINDSVDATITPEFTSTQGGQIAGIFRDRFNDGDVNLRGAIGHDQGTIGGYLFANTLFSLDDTWRYGANIKVSSSVDYLRDYQVDGYGGNVLGSNVFIEGFGVGSYARLDSSGYQVLNGPVSQTNLPYVLPRFTYSFFGEPDFLGGRTSFDLQAFNVLREQGTSDRRVAGRTEWDRPFAGYLGDQWLFTVQGSGTYYTATSLNAQPNFGDASNSSNGHGQVQTAVRLNWPFVRDAGSLGTQIIEPIVQLIAAPQSGNSRHDELPNEDSLGYEFSDSTLFTLNRFGGYDRYDGGLRANFALHGNWTFLGHQQIDAILGAAVDQHLTTNEYAQYYGLTGFTPGSHLSDIVGRVTFAPNKWVDFTARARVDHSTGDLHYGEIVTGFGPPQLRVGLNYFYGSVNPFDQYLDAVFAPDLPYKNAITANYLQPRQELGGAVTAHYGRYSAVVGARTDTATGQLSNLTFDAKYEDECTIFDIHFLRRYTSINGDHGNTALLFTITFKTVGPIGFTG